MKNSLCTLLFCQISLYFTLSCASCVDFIWCISLVPTGSLRTLADCIDQAKFSTAHANWCGGICGLDCYRSLGAGGTTSVGAGRVSTAYQWSWRLVARCRALVHPYVSFKFKFNRWIKKLAVLSVKAPEILKNSKKI
jgi:hypothetical protein